jgi:hypothetical protein
VSSHGAISEPVTSDQPPNTPPMPQETAGSLYGQESLARTMSDGELVRLVDHTLQAGRHHPDFRVPDQLFTQLASHPFVVEKMPTKDLVKLFVALNEFRDSRLDGLRERVDAALNKRIGEMELSPPVAHIGATPAGVRAAFVDRLSSLKEDVETLSLLAKESSNLPRDRKTELAAAIAKAISKTSVKLVEVMVQGTEEKSPRIISKAVDLAKLAHTTLCKLNPQEPSDLEAFLTTALLTHHPRSLLEAELILGGKAETAEGVGLKFAALDDSNAVSVAVKRRMDEADTPNNRETRNLHLFSRALGYAILPSTKWAEPTGPGKANTSNLFFGDEKTWPTGGVAQLNKELNKAKGWPPANVDCCKKLLLVLEGIHAIRHTESLTQKEAERLTSPLQELIVNHKVHEKWGNQKSPYKWDLTSLVTLSPRDRATKLREMLEPARIGVQRRIIGEVNDGRYAAEKTILDAAQQAERMARIAWERKSKRGVS